MRLTTSGASWVQNAGAAYIRTARKKSRYIESFVRNGSGPRGDRKGESLALTPRARWSTVDT